jgi:hypothetical protein
MHQIEAKIYNFLHNRLKDYKILEHLLAKFGEESKAALKAQFEREPRDFRLSMSMIGRPICILQWEQSGIQGESTDNAIRFLYGELCEDIVIFLLHASGIPIISEQEEVELDIDGYTLKGRLDIVTNIDGIEEVWDIKSASAWAFKNKFTNFEQLVEGDSFGYISQLFLYAEARGCKPGGFIVFDKSSGEINVLKIPEEQREYYRERTLKDAAKKIATLFRLKLCSMDDLNETEMGLSISANNSDKLEGVNIDRQFSPVEEVFRKRPTGNLVLTNECSMCPHKWNCWKGLQLLPQAKSNAKIPKMVYYVKYEGESNV